MTSRLLGITIHRTYWLVIGLMLAWKGCGTTSADLSRAPGLD